VLKWLLPGAHVAWHLRFISHHLLAIRYHHLHKCWLSTFNRLVLLYLFLSILAALFGHRQAE